MRERGKGAQPMNLLPSRGTRNTATERRGEGGNEVDGRSKNSQGVRGREGAKKKEVSIRRRRKKSLRQWKPEGQEDSEQRAILIGRGGGGQ